MCVTSLLLFCKYSIISFTVMSIVNRILLGGFRGGIYAMAMGIILGAAGSVIAPPIDYQKVLVWTNRFGKPTRFTNLDSVDVIKEDLLVLFRARHVNISAFNEAFRNLQSAITIFHPIHVGEEKAQIMSATKMTNYTIRASKAMEAILVSMRSSNVIESEKLEKSMMSIQLSMEELINSVRHQSKNALPVM